MFELESNNFNFSSLKVHKIFMNNHLPKMHYSGEDVKVWQDKFRVKLKELLGFENISTEHCTLNVRSFWKRNTEFGTIEKIAFTAEIGHDIPAYLCLPYNMQTPAPFFICLQRHSTGMHVSVALEQNDENKTMTVEGDRDFCMECMRRGIASIAIEQRGFGMCEDAHNKYSRCENPAVHAMMLGRTLLGERIFDVDRTIDYLATRDDVDMQRIGIMGNSGGGTVSMFAGGILERLAWVMPSCSFSSFKASIMNIEHCICNYIPQMLLWGEMSDVVALAAPKPLVIVSGREDIIFPIKDAQKGFAEIRNVYRKLSAESHCHHVIGNGGHRFYATDAWPIMLKEMSLF